MAVEIKTDKLMWPIEAIQPVKDGDTVVIGGFGPLGYPAQLVKALYLFSNAKDLHIALNAPNGMYLPTLDRLIAERASHLTTTFVRTSRAATKFFKEGKLTLTPQGTFAERLRAAGAGIPGFYTPVGIGTMVAEGKEVKEFNGRQYLLEEALNADVGFMQATKVDYDGNCYIEGAMKSFGALVPAASKYTVVEAEEIVPVGDIPSELITVSGIYIDGIVKVGMRHDQ
ncbi:MULTISPECIES: CoA transferase subunit A [Lacticaseibacillus]|uniref:3-oxoacid CoA-transferase subunit A n=3 Tax=Lacticaseibacillus TaxID=2759736 RepID=A0ABZ0BWF6_LACCA|nr:MULTISPECIES: 3-oxoacid CoA-transferase subunit A [Lacticaseibacillus]KAB1968230.1 CoA transferase subunit A [Lacticaseibacillus casei]WLV80374.1 3-oxoacid CoA-transferase subunit A [Lacticaseibacillus sp. NCIMB 15473]WNX24335.1 3-oxoacid CoA-transferase subunit A [Lacticaseibacillus casei]WNX27108.1 3-oxoacid CoA-transferase subunit A [Lacticaseibacillus casei]